MSTAARRRFPPKARHTTRGERVCCETVCAVPVYGTYADRVREMLQQYATISDGKVRLEFYDPEDLARIITINAAKLRATIVPEAARSGCR